MLLRLTMVPPVGAFPVSVTVPVVICWEPTFVGLKDSIVTTGGITVRPPPAAVPLGSVAVTVTAVLLATGDVVTLNVPLLCGPAITKLPLAGTVTAPLLLIKATVKPVGGAGPLRVTVPTEPEPAPPVTELGLNVNDVMTAGLTVSVPLVMIPVAIIPVTVTTVCVATPTVVTVKVCEVFVAKIVTLAGTVMGVVPAGVTFVILKETTIPPVGAA